ncbi:MAG TPA: four-carbon acid sugar kinase family protein [Dehalococcoidia bacterium]|nr:four-carbon acid sugar kinase family protein [Dehalococcoidia bacterium]
MTPQTLGIVADDLTGAMDSSGYFATLGWGTVVVLAPGFSADADVVVITTNSRAENPDIARKRVKQAVRSLAGRVVYKKIDSTLRGNIGAELEAAIEELASQKTIVAPAFPVVGRTTVTGNLLVNGTPVAQTQFAQDPILPVKESHIPTLLERSTGRQVGVVTVKDIEAGPESLYCRISEMPQDIVVCDVTEESHLTGIAQAAALAEGRWLLCGSGGLARELHLLVRKTPGAKRAKPRNLSSGPALVVVGTRNQVAANQLLKARDELGLPILNLDTERLSEEDASAYLVAEANRLLIQGRGLALSSTFSQYAPELKHTIPAIMAEIATKILASRRFAGLFLSGGDIALEVCRRLGVSAIRVHGEVEPGVPAGELIGGACQGMRVVTKAGGFGTEEALVKSISYLEKGNLS